MKEKVLQNKQAKLEKLLNSAYELFITKGIQDTSIHEITSSAGVAKGTFYLYFKDKYSLRDYLVTRSARRLFHNAHVALEQETGVTSFEDRFLFISNHIIHELEQNKPLLAFISRNLSWGLFRHLATEGIQEDHMSGLQIFEKLAEESGITLRNPDLMVFLIVEMTNASIYSAIFGDGSITLDRVLPELNEATRSIIRSHIL